MMMRLRFHLFLKLHLWCRIWNSVGNLKLNVVIHQFHFILILLNISFIHTTLKMKMKKMISSFISNLDQKTHIKCIKHMQISNSKMAAKATNLIFQKITKEADLMMKDFLIRFLDLEVWNEEQKKNFTEWIPYVWKQIKLLH